MKSTKTMKIQEQRFFQSELNSGKSGVTITLPEDILNHLKLKKGLEKQTVHCVVINGVVQITGEEPNATIPIISLEEEFTTPRN